MRVLLPAALMTLAACGGGPSEASSSRPGRGVLVIAIDSLRQDHTTLGGYDQNTTPKLAGLFEQEGIVFGDAWSTGPALMPSHSGVLTGCAPTVVRRPKVTLTDGTVVPPITEWFVPWGVPTLADEFTADGWTTAAFVNHPLLEGNVGLRRGFRHFEGGSRSPQDEAFLGGVGRRFIDWTKELDADEDWFAYVHLHDLVALWGERFERFGPDLRQQFPPRESLDYVPPVAARSPAFFALPAGRVLDGSPPLGAYEARYDAAVAWMDMNLHRLINMLGDRGDPMRTTIVVVGTYGVSFGESGMLVDSGALSPADLNVPMMIRPATDLKVPVGERREELVSLTDLAPTLLTLHGLPVPSGMHGENLAPLLHGNATLERDRLLAGYGTMEGFCVITEDDVFSRFDPRSRGAGTPLALSWYGAYRGSDEGIVRILFDRDEPVSEWLDGERDGRSERAQELEAWLDHRLGGLRRAQEVLHRDAWTSEPSDSELAELRDQGLIGGGE